MKNKTNILKIFLLLIVAMFTTNIYATETEESEDFKPGEVIFGHTGDSYEWHITKMFDKEIAIPLPIIVYSQTKGFNVFCYSKLHGGKEYNGFYIAKEGDFVGKVVEINAEGNEVRPLDLSLTKNALALLINSFLLVFIILYVAKWYKKNPMTAPKGFRGAVEMLTMSIQDDVIKPSVGKDYKKFSPYLLTIFFFIFINNLMGLIPLFPGGANTTGNIAITCVLALITMLVVNIFGTKEYWKDIFVPAVPLWLRSPIFPLMPALELFGVFTKPFALMIRLFANILAGHSIILAFVCLIFVVAKMSAGISVTMTAVAVVFTIFMNFLELLVAFIQAYVFVMLASVFIGLARIEPHEEKKIIKE